MNTPFDALKTFLDNNPDLPTGDDLPQPAEASSSRPSPVRLDIVLERKGRAGKTATIITGFAAGGVDDAEVSRVASVLKSRLGTGGSARGGEILVQGDRRSDVLRELQSMGYKARVV